MKQKIIIFTVLIITSALIVKLSHISTNGYGYDLETYKAGNGWGYTIFVKNKVFIKQDIIPGIPAKKPFATEKDAVIVGELMIEKLKSKKIPSISYKELQINGVIL
ncbi:MAG: hypothetical protein CVU08_05105 [Bacteroidetes bacterium HGW-Bacteroidetes-3]|jgi:serine protease inhibitor ecotin|nr:MAG: hypothetical protein CVU08_05105 [Bacteroidetes bacterium HGW-Bacteroidetes-3]